MKNNTEIISNIPWKKKKTWPCLPRLNSFWNVLSNTHSSPLGSHLPGLCIRTESQKCQTSHWHNDRNADHRTKEAVPGRNHFKRLGQQMQEEDHLSLPRLSCSCSTPCPWLAAQWHSHLALAFYRLTENSSRAGSCIYSMKLGIIHVPSTVLGASDTPTTSLPSFPPLPTTLPLYHI